LVVATKIPPKNRVWPSRRGFDFNDVFPDDYVFEYLAASCENLGRDRVDLLQYHVWEDEWARDARWLAQVERLRADGRVDRIGISVNRWEPGNVLAAVGSGLVDWVQVIYNIFDQAPEDELLPACRDAGVAVVARVPFDEGSLTGTFTAGTTWPEGDWRNSYFVPENLAATLERVAALRPVVPVGWEMAELALRFILNHPDITTVIPGMRSVRHVRANLGVADGAPLPDGLLAALRGHRWDREPTDWSQ
jgi:aryl-alcohol dehydrogenase-like predicted oxidoreductase